MAEWQMMFKDVQKIARLTNTFVTGMEATIHSAHSNVKLFNDQEYWNKVQRHRMSRAANIVVDWAKNGLENLNRREGWEFLILDLGDCPELFSLYSPGGQTLIEEQKLRHLLLHNSVIEAEDIEQCFGRNVGDPFIKLFGEEKTELVNHNAIELNDEVLSWNAGGSFEFHGDSGYFFWLAVGSLALLEPLRNADYCKRILDGRSRVYLLSGFESIFLYLATVTPDGLLFESDKSTPQQREHSKGVHQMQLPL